ncbi:palindromic element RPE1 domain-containing protein [Rickettsia amblyommatis]|nr:palindromic element RPE1 domain-containing protein [Rickettsia amblyommatis]
MHNVANREEFEGNTEALATAAYIKIREDVSTRLTYKLTYKFTLRRKLYKKFNLSGFNSPKLCFVIY